MRPVGIRRRKVSLAVVTGGGSAAMHKIIQIKRTKHRVDVHVNHSGTLELVPLTQS